MKKFLLCYAVLTTALLACACRSCRHARGESRRLADNQTALASEVERYRTRLGEEAASGLGVNVGKSRTLCLLVVLVLAGAAVALAGPVAFVGLMVPHMVRRFVGSDYRAVIPASMVGGALFMLLADVLARTLMAPSEIPIGIIFAIVGVPFFIWCARREASGLD